MATETRTSEHGNIFPVAIVRDFLLKALGHDAVVDEVNELLFDHVVGHKHHPSVIAASLKPMLEEVLGVATAEDWGWVTRALTADACEALGVKHPLDHAPKKARALGNLDAGELREKLAEIYTQRPVSLNRALLALWIIRRLSQQTGISRKQIKADAKANALAMRTAEGDTATGAHQRSAHTPAPAEVTLDAGTPPITAARRVLRPMLENGGVIYIEDTKGTEYEGWVIGLTPETVTVQEHGTGKIADIHLSDIQNMVEAEVDPSQTLVRKLTSDDAFALECIQTGQRPGYLDAGTRAAILLGSNIGCTTSQLAAMLVVEESDVRKVIADFNQHGIPAVRSPR
jgi:hypothetical protein